MAHAQIRQEQTATISFKGAHFPKDVILYAVFFYLRCGVPNRDLEEIMAERGVELDHATLNRWVSRYAGLVADALRHKKGPTDRSWRMDETYVKVKGEWVYSMAPSTNTAKPWTSCYPNAGIKLLQRSSSLVRLR